MSAELRVAERLTGAWKAVPDAGRAGFRVRDKMFGHTSGSIPVRSGTVRIGPGGDLEFARVELDVTGIDTANTHRDRDLRKPHFLSADRHPTIVVETGPAASRAPGWSVAAMVTARGARAPVDLAVSLESVDDESATVTVTVTGRLDRTPLGMKVPTFIVGRIIEVQVRLVFRRS